MYQERNENFTVRCDRFGNQKKVTPYRKPKNVDYSKWYEEDEDNDNDNE